MVKSIGDHLASILCLCSYRSPPLHKTAVASPLVLLITRFSPENMVNGGGVAVYDLEEWRFGNGGCGYEEG
ncbi:uncharacterized protein G2W53_036898 [Senna tora]|uniref:Uncharacterized protein n=1 Tax=Senna tora TaxID=362788 RepID=A0A834W580_9FABA|nr:uncharacterized protein G2W53_036898 [Senna tora]